MAYTVPTADQFLTRFPVFETTDSDLVDAVLAEAALQLDDSWLEQDYAIAIMYLAAHMLTMEGVQRVDRPGGIVAESFGPMSVSYGAGGASNSALDATEYGRRFKVLQAKNFPGIVVV